MSAMFINDQQYMSKVKHGNCLKYGKNQMYHDHSLYSLEGRSLTVIKRKYDISCT